MLRNVILRSASVLRDNKAVTAAEYAILAVGVVVIVAGAIAALGPAITNAFTQVGTEITAGVNAVR